MIDNKIRLYQPGTFFNEWRESRDAGSHDSNRHSGPLEPSRKAVPKLLMAWKLIK